MYAKDVRFQQDGASCYTAAHTNNCFEDMGLAPSKFSNHKLYKNDRLDSFEAVNSGEKQYKTVSYVKELLRMSEKNN